MMLKVLLPKPLLMWVLLASLSDSHAGSMPRLWLLSGVLMPPLLLIQQVQQQPAS
jgi:hypothetical protein